MYNPILMGSTPPFDIALPNEHLDEAAERRRAHLQQRS
jgi:hypothetical protein